MSIELNNVTFNYDKDIQALKNINLKIEDGEFIGIMGANGSGKSSLAEILASLIKPSKGKLIYKGLNSNDIGILFQFVENQLFETTVKKEVGFILKNKGIYDERQIKESIELFGFDYDLVKDLSPFEFSLGEKRKIAIASILAGKPKVLILDETFAGLDKDGKEILIKILLKLNKEKTTIILISHNSDLICEYAKRVIILKEGTIYKDGDLYEVFKDYKKLLKDGIDIGYVRKIAEHLNVRATSCIKYDDLLKEIIRNYHHE